jgi:hypothetical protein
MKTPVLILCFLVGFATNASAQPSLQAPVSAPGHGAALADAHPDKNNVRRMAILRGLDKVSGRAVDISAPAGVPVRFGSLTITMRFCYTVPPEERPETAAFVQIDDGKPGDKQVRMFSGWMFASTPALNGLEHPVYDVWVITCKTDEPAIAGKEVNPASAGAIAGAPADIPPPHADAPAKPAEVAPAERGLPANPSSR